MRIDRRELLRRVGGAGLGLPLLAASGAVGMAGVPPLILDIHYPNMFGDLSAGSGLNSLSRDPDFAADFVARHSRKLLWGSDCYCHDGKGATYPRGYCIAQRSLDRLREYLPDPLMLRRITYDNGARMLRLRT